MTHTSGTWKVTEEIRRHGSVMLWIENENGNIITHMLATDPFHNNQRLPCVDDNARLIATAPDLLAVCKYQNELLKKLTIAAINEEVKSYLPYGLLEEIRAYIKQNKVDATIAHAERQE